MKKAKTFSAFVNGIPTVVKAFKKESAVQFMQNHDATIRYKNVTLCNSMNSHQAPIDENI